MRHKLIRALSLNSIVLYGNCSPTIMMKNKWKKNIFKKKIPGKITWNGNGIRTRNVIPKIISSQKKNIISVMHMRLTKIITINFVSVYVLLEILFSTVCILCFNNMSCLYLFIFCEIAIRCKDASSNIYCASAMNESQRNSLDYHFFLCVPTHNLFIFFLLNSYCVAHLRIS